MTDIYLFDQHTFESKRHSTDTKPDDVILQIVEYYDLHNKTCFFPFTHQDGEEALESMKKNSDDIRRNFLEKNKIDMQLQIHSVTKKNFLNLHCSSEVLDIRNSFAKSLKNA